jgi:hypothetical protein
VTPAHRAEAVAIVLGFDRIGASPTSAEQEVIRRVARRLADRDDALPEWTCPACGATTRARMADSPV